jgi:hypothetical protein
MRTSEQWFRCTGAPVRPVLVATALAYQNPSLQRMYVHASCVLMFKNPQDNATVPQCIRRARLKLLKPSTVAAIHHYNDNWPHERHHCEPYTM